MLGTRSAIKPLVPTPQKKRRRKLQRMRLQIIDGIHRQHIAFLHWNVLFAIRHVGDGIAGALATFAVDGIRGAYFLSVDVEDHR